MLNCKYLTVNRLGITVSPLLNLVLATSCCWDADRDKKKRKKVRVNREVDGAKYKSGLFFFF